MAPLSAAGETEVNALQQSIATTWTPVGVALVGGQFITSYCDIFAASVVAVVVPIAILVFIFRKNVVSGLTAGAVKG